MARAGCWNHNVQYQPVILGAVPPGCASALSLTRLLALPCHLAAFASPARLGRRHGSPARRARPPEATECPTAGRNRQQMHAECLRAGALS